MIDRITKRSALTSLVFHAGLCVLAFWPAWRHSLTPPELPAQLPATAPRLVLAPTPAPAAAPPLPVLSDAGLPGAQPDSAIDAFTPRASDHPGTSHSRGVGGELPGLATVPALPGATPIAIAGGRTATPSEPELDREQRRYADAATFLENRLQDEYRRSWTRFTPRVTGRQVVLRVTVDARGHVTAAELLSHTGVAELDTAIERWLRRTDPPLGLPPLTSGRPHPFRVTLFSP